MTRRSKQLADIWASDFRHMTFWERCVAGWQLWRDNVAKWPLPVSQTNPELWEDAEFTIGSLLYPIRNQEVKEIDYSGCPAVSVGGYHSQSFGDDGIYQCDWCGAKPPHV